MVWVHKLESTQVPIIRGSFAKHSARVSLSSSLTASRESKVTL